MALPPAPRSRPSSPYRLCDVNKACTVSSKLEFCDTSHEVPVKPPSKVLWGEGLFLRPQHFQQQDRYHEARLNDTAHALHPYCWGVRKLELDHDALKADTLRITE